jgi:hypothetical protein
MIGKSVFFPSLHIRADFQPAISIITLAGPLG